MNERKDAKAFHMVTWMLLVYAFLACMPWFEIVREKTPEEVAHQWQTFSRLNHNMVMPDERPVRPSPTEIDQFHLKYVNPIWTEAKKRAMAGDYYFEDYFEDLKKWRDLSEEHLMPLQLGTVAPFIEKAAMDFANAESFRAGVRYPEQHTMEEVRDAVLPYLNEYRNWYDYGTRLADPEIQWKPLLYWFVVSYLKLMVVCALIFLLRIRRDPDTTVREELLCAPLRFCKMVLGWPIAIMTYPYLTEPAIWLRYEVLRAEYLRGKDTLQLTDEERESLKKLAVSRSPLKQIISRFTVQFSSAKIQTRSRIVVYSFVLSSIILGSLLRLTVVVQQQATVGAVAAASSVVMMIDQARDGPSTHVEEHAPDQLIAHIVAVVPTVFVVILEVTTTLTIQTERLLRSVTLEIEPPIPKLATVTIRC